MNSEEIRAKAIDRIARAEYDSWKVEFDKLSVDEGLPLAPSFDDARISARASAKRYALASAKRAVDALGDLLPTHLEIERGLWAQTGDGRKHRLEPDRYQYTTGWRDATDSDSPDLKKD